MNQLSIKPQATLSLDLDNEWSYLKTHGDEGWDSFPSYLDAAVPRFLSLFDTLGIRVTVFVVGQDAVLSKNHPALKSIVAHGHEIGNHSFAHEPWLHLYPDPQLEAEITKGEDSIANVLGVRPVGFRGPGYSISSSVLHILAKRNYLYDASTLPTFLGPIARAYYFMTTQLDQRQRQERKVLFGSVKDGLRPIKPYMWSLGEQCLLEIPVTTFPLLRFPFHVSYLLYLSRFSVALAQAYFRSALELCLRTGVEPSVLIHPLDLLGKDDVTTLTFFPGMDLTSEIKMQRTTQFLSELAKHFNVMPMGEYARGLESRRTIVLRLPER
jgi:hypothetical protein